MPCPVTTMRDPCRRAGLQDDKRLRRDVNYPVCIKTVKFRVAAAKRNAKRSYAADSSNLSRSGATENSQKQPAYPSRCTALDVPDALAMQAPSAPQLLS
jgi:hypothetical protein